MNSDQENELSRQLINPFNATVLAQHLFDDKTASTKEDWVVLNAKLMEDMGIGIWLRQFLEAVSLPKAEYDGHDIINPALAVIISDSLKGVHEPLVTHDQWLAANTKLIGELGIANWLWRLLEVLEIGNN